MLSLSTMYYVASLAFIPILIAAIFGIRSYRFADKNERLIVYLMVIACVCELISSALWRGHLNNIWVSHVLAPVEFALLGSYFGSHFGRVMYQIVIGFVIGFAAFALFNVFVLNRPTEMNDLPRTIECALLIVLSLLVYGKIMQSFTQRKLTDLPIFWFNSAVIIYFSSNVLLFYFSHYVANLSNGLSTWIWSFHLFFMTIYYVLFSIGLWKIRRKPHSST